MRLPSSIGRRTLTGAPSLVLPLAAALLALVLLAVPGPATAHDFWIEPSDFRPAVGTPVSLDLRVGHAGETDPVARNPERQVRFVARSPDGETRDVPGVDGSAPAGYLVPDTAGVWTVGYRSTDAVSELPADRFDAYLEEEGLGWAVERRRETGRSASSGRELYSRSVKSLLEVGEGGGRSTLFQPLGLDFEIVPVDDPFPRSGQDEETRFQVLHRGEPAAGVLVEAHLLGNSDGIQSQMSDDGGHVAFRFDHPGAWILAAVVIEEIDPSDDDRGADWRSVWTSLTFECPAQ